MTGPVAVIADAHVFDPGAFALPFPALRPWADVATAPRAVNESLAAFTAALDRSRARGVRHVVLLGDYTDDGQVAVTARLAALLHDQTARHGLRFHTIPGNHDIYGPHGKHVATRISTGPSTAVLTSDPRLAAAEPGAILAPGMACAGQPEGLMPLAAFGLFRRPEDLHWESPFGPSDALADRTYLARSADGSVTHRLFDASYLVEPEAGLWLLLLDANVFRPRNGIADPRRKRAFHNPSEAGWNAVLTEKPFLMDWIADVQARAGGKRLLVMSHYPVADPFQDDGTERALFGASDEARRTPGAEVAQRLAAAGVRQHFGGHLHANSVTEAHGLTHVSVTSTSAFPPGFVVVDAAGVETISLADVALPPDLLAFYRAAGGTPAGTLGPFLWQQIRARTLAHHLPRLFPRGLPLGVAPDLVADWYAIRQAGPLARPYLSDARLAELRALAAEGDAGADPATPDGFRRRFLSMLARALARMDG